MKAPLALTVIPLALGIVMADALPFGIPLWLVFVAAVMLLALYGFLLWLERRRAVGWWLGVVVLEVAMLLVGYGLYAGRRPELRSSHYTRYLSRANSLQGFGQRCGLRGTVVESPSERPRSYKVLLSLCSMEDSAGVWHRCDGRILAYVQKSAVAAALRQGDTVSACAAVGLAADSIGRDGFDYRRYLHRNGIERQCYIDSLSLVVAPRPGSGILSVGQWFAALRGSMLSRIRCTSLTDSQKGVAEAMLLGWKEDVDEATRRQFQQAGISHLLCVSGLHVGIVAWLAGVALSWMGRRRWERAARSVAQLAVVWFFVMLTGAAPSAMRAGLMFSFIIVGNNLSDGYNIYNNLFLSALVLLLINPSVLFSVSFQLSYCAVFGIAAVRPLLYPRFLMSQTQGRNLLKRSALWLWQLCLVSVAAQTATLPLVLYYFHTLPLYFLIANVVVVPFAGLLLATLLVMALLVGVGPLGGWAARLASLELNAIDAITSWVGRLPHAVVDNIYCTPLATVLLAAAVAALAIAVDKFSAKDFPAI
ncbi:MAG: ComEC/Rec2 family competence protein [Bacteroidales bacterium]|nr:ComEC/Rec2 family competence protein [Bacteroidales bacterium]